MGPMDWTSPLIDLIHFTETGEVKDFTPPGEDLPRLIHTMATDREHQLDLEYKRAQTNANKRLR